MYQLPLSLLALWLATPVSVMADITPGGFADGGNTQVSAMMMFVANEEKVYILDKAESNKAQVAGHPAWGSRWDINTHQTDLMDIKTNTFCASGMHLPNGSFITFGGNDAVGPNGRLGSQPYPGTNTASFDSTIGEYDGRKSIRILNPCSGSDDINSDKCKWFDDPSVLSMQRNRWYAAVEPLADGSMVIMGGFVAGGYINRNFPTDHPDPIKQGGAAENTFEVYPWDGKEPEIVDFLVTAEGLNSYAHMYLMPSGKIFMQANISTTLWDHTTNKGDPLPDMPKGVVRVYPASGATAMLPLTPKNGYTPTILFCGGNDMSGADWGNYAWPHINTWENRASKDCQRITPEPIDGSAAAYEQDDDMLDPRTMGQFIYLPTGKLLIVNGAANGTAGYSNVTDVGNTNPWGWSLASEPVLTPALYDPEAAKGSRWSNAGLQASKIPRLYHSTAILLPDGSVMIAGSNPNVDVATDVPYPTTYDAEIFYPSYFKATTRPQPSGIPKTLSYGGDPFDITVPASSFSGSSNDAAEGAIISVIRPGWTTHGMNMNQRFLQLNTTYTVNSDGSLTFHVSQMPPTPNVFQPGPAFVFVTINDVPSKGSYVIVGSGQIGKQPTAAASSLPGSVRLDSAKGTADGASTSNGDDNTGGKKKGSASTIAVQSATFFSAFVLASTITCSLL